MANPFTVQPLGGIQNLQMIGQGMQGIGQNIQASREQERRQQLMQQAAEVMDRGDPREIAQFSMQNPEIGEAMMGGIKFKDDVTRENLKTSMQGIIAGRDPEQILMNRIQTVEERGGDASDTRRELEVLREMGPEQYRKLVQNEYAMAFGDEGLPGTGGPNIGQYNPRDYTTESFAEFVKTKDPSVLERYAAQRSVDIGGVPHVFDPAMGGYRPAGVVAGGAAQPVTAATVAESQAQIEGEKQRARQEVAAEAPEKVRERRDEIEKTQVGLAATEDVVSQADQLLNNEKFLDAVTGIRGVLPPAPGTPGYDATVALDRLKNSLTLGNLDKMSGVLSESDIKILASEAGGLEAGMSKPAMVKRLNKIKSVFEDKGQRAVQKLQELMSETQRTEGRPGSQQGQRAPIRIRLDEQGNIIQ